MVNTEGLNQGSVLAALYNSSRVLGMGRLQAIPGHVMTSEEGSELVKKHSYFDYLHGKVMKVDLRNPDQFDPRLYDRDNGDGAAQRVITGLQNT